MNRILYLVLLSVLPFGLIAQVNNNGVHINIVKDTWVHSTLAITNSTTASIKLGGYLTVDGNFDNNGTFVIESGSSFIDNGTISGTGTTKVQLHLTKGRHYVSNPTVTATISGVFTGTFADSYKESTNEWEAMANGDVLGIARGYSVLSIDDGDYEFTGKTNTGPLQMVLENTGGGWNLVGNPYPLTCRLGCCIGMGQN